MTEEEKPTTLQGLERYAEERGLDFYELLLEYLTVTDLARIASRLGLPAAQLLPPEPPKSADA